VFDRLSATERMLFRAAYFEPAAAIRLAAGTEPDGAFVRARSEFIIPNGIEDRAGGFALARASNGAVTRLLWVSNLHESKGIFVLLEACGILHQRGVPFELAIVGSTSTDTVTDRIVRTIEELGIKARVQMPGQLTGDEKWRTFARADVFCLPTHYEREGMPLVVLEAMQFALPVVATRWRGIPSMVQDGETGFLVPVRDSVATADRLEQLIRNPDLRRAFGAAARAEFERNFTLPAFAARIERALLSL
jgi:glycosyltransferase involved in cell wall biosynthesis